MGATMTVTNPDVGCLMTVQIAGRYVNCDITV